MKARFTAAASEDLREARAFVAWKFGREIRKRLNSELRRSVSLLCERPFAGKAGGRTAREYVLKGYPYSLIYFVEQDEIVIAALSHHSRDPEFWHDRFGPER